MDKVTDNLACEQCGQHISTDELAQGLAVKVNGQLVCANCVDALPGEAQVRINQVRALRGLEVVTYQVLRPAHPGLHLYTFTTATNLNQLRRGMLTGAVTAPPVLDLSNKSTLPPALVRPALLATAARKPGRPKFVLIAAALGAAALLAIALSFALGGKPASGEGGAAPGRPAPREAPPALVQNKVRADFAVDPRQAWDAASQDQGCPPDQLKAIAEELVRQRGRELDAAEQALAAGNSAEAARLLTASELPDHLFFRSLRSREDELRKRPAGPPPSTPPPVAIGAPPPAAPVADPAPIARAMPATVSPPAAPAPSAAPPLPAAVAASSLDVIRIPCADFLAFNAPAAWSRMDERDQKPLRLDADRGECSRTLQLAGGRYQAWIHAAAPHDGGSGEVVVHIGGQTLQAKIANRAREWIQLQPASIVLTAGASNVQIEASGKGLVVSLLYLAGSDQVDPHNHKFRATAKPPQWAEHPPVATPVPGAPAAARTAAWTPRFFAAASELNPYDEKSRVPNGLPIGCDRVFESQLGKGRKRQILVLDLTGSSLDKGGMVLLLHPLRSDRRQVAVTLVDQKDHAITFPALEFPQNDWTTRILTLDAIPAGERTGFVASQLKSLTIEDHDLFTTGFLFGKLAVSSDPAPTVAALELRPPTLQPVAYRDLDRLLEGIAARRKWRTWRKDFNPGLVKVLISPTLLSHQYAEDVRQLFNPLLRGEELIKDRLPDEALDDLKLAPDYAKRLFADQAPLLPERFQVAVFFLAGSEPLPDFANPAAFTAFWLQQIIDPCLNHGILPVAVLGPKELRPGGLDLEKQWADLEQALHKTRAGVPVIDLRTVTGIGGAEMESAAMADAARALADGYGELVKRLRALQKAAPRP